MALSRDVTRNFKSAATKSSWAISRVSAELKTGLTDV
jgi:hypothetical protein